VIEKIIIVTGEEKFKGFNQTEKLLKIMF